MDKIFTPEVIEEFQAKLAKILVLRNIKDCDKYWNIFKVGVDLTVTDD